MLLFTNKLVSGLKTALISGIITRNKGSVSDPVQQLFIDKIRGYWKRSPDDKMLDPSPLVIKELQKELEKLEKRYGGGPGVDMIAFPTFKLEEPKLDPIEVIPEKGKRGKKKNTKAVKMAGPVKKGPVKKGPRKKGPVKRGRGRRGPVKRGRGKRGPVKRGPVKKGPVKKGPAKKGPVKKGPVKKTDPKKK